MREHADLDRDRADRVAVAAVRTDAPLQSRIMLRRTSRSTSCSNFRSCRPCPGTAPRTWRRPRRVMMSISSWRASLPGMRIASVRRADVLRAQRGVQVGHVGDGDRRALRLAMHLLQLVLRRDDRADVLHRSDHVGLARFAATAFDHDDVGRRADHDTSMSDSSSWANVGITTNWPSTRDARRRPARGTECPRTSEAGAADERRDVPRRARSDGRRSP